jgi:hypothetical protein
MILPYKFKPRPYQLEVIKAFFDGKYKRFVNIWHRRAGKDRTWFNILVGAAMQKVGMYIYSFPTLTQARRVIWEGRGKDGIRFLDQIPQELIKNSPNNTEMKIELINGSIIRLGGTDYYNSWMGTNPLGIVFSEYSLQNPLAWDLIRPILVENEGWAAFVYTPRSRNHGYELYATNKSNKNWYTSLLTIKDTTDWNNNQIISEEAIAMEAEAGMSEDLIDQEFYCSFEAALRGAIFSLQLRKIYEENRITVFPIESTIPVNTFWDIGYDGSTSIWLIQKDMKKDYWNLIFYYENQEQKLSHYMNVLQDLRDKLQISYRCHYLPHDALKHSLATGLTFAEEVNKFGVRTETVPRIAAKNQAIELARVMLNKVQIHEENCNHGIECLKSYCKAWYEELGVYSERPVHNWASHGADAFMTFAQALNLLDINDVNFQRIRYNCVNMGSL